MSASSDPGQPPVTTPVLAPSRGPSAGSVLVGIVAVVVAAVVVALVSAPPATPTPTPPRIAASALATSPEASAVPPDAAAATATVVVLRGLSDPASVLGTLTGCTQLSRVTGQPSTAVQGADVDAVAATARRDTGWLLVPPGPTKVWLGDDVVGLAAAVGQPMVAVGPKGEVWLGDRAGATRWTPIATPQGRTAWAMNADEVTGAGPCSRWTVPSDIDGLRSLTCAGLDVTACLALLPVAKSNPVELFLPASDLVVAVPPCIDSHRCFATPLTFIETPEAWTGSFSDLVAVSRDPTTGALAVASQLAGYAVDALARPALPLPTGGIRVRGNPCSQTLAGQLAGAPWDPRVAWVGRTAVVWPVGTVVRFMPFEQLITPGDPNGPFATHGDRVVLTGMLDPRGPVFDACRVALASGVGGLAPSPGVGG